MVSWTAHPFRHHRTRGLAALAVVLILAAGLAVIVRSPVWGFFAGAVLFLSLEAFFLPTRYQLGPEEISIQAVFSSGRRPYSQFRCVYEDAHGLTLSPYRRRARGRAFLEPYRATRLLLDGADRDRVRSVVRAHLPVDIDWLVAPGTSGGDTGADPGRANRTKANVVST